MRRGGADGTSAKQAAKALLKKMAVKEEAVAMLPPSRLRRLLVVVGLVGDEKNPVTVCESVGKQCSRGSRGGWGGWLWLFTRLDPWIDWTTRTNALV